MSSVSLAVVREAYTPGRDVFFPALELAFYQFDLGIQMDMLPSRVFYFILSRCWMNLHLSEDIYLSAAASRILDKLHIRYTPYPPVSLSLLDENTGELRDRICFGVLSLTALFVGLHRCNYADLLEIVEVAY